MIHATTTCIKINTILRTCDLPLLKIFTLSATLRQWPLRHLSSSLSDSDKEKGEQLRSITARPGNLWPCCLPWHKMTGKRQFKISSFFRQWPLVHLSGSVRIGHSKGEQPRFALRTSTTGPGNLLPCCLPWQKMTAKRCNQTIRHWLYLWH